MEQEYHSILSLYETQDAIGYIKQRFQLELAQRLNLIRATAPLFVDPTTGLNDNLSGKERAVSFDIPAVSAEAQVVHSLAKWKRQALRKYGFTIGKGLFTDMNAIRRDETPDALHSFYVDQWDWERVITPQQRNTDYLNHTVQQIVDAIYATYCQLQVIYPQLNAEISDKVTFITAQELEDLYPELSSKERENAFVRSHSTTFIIGIGEKLRSGAPHDSRAPDYDDWQLNGDLLMWDDVLKQAVELSSMGIRVDSVSMKTQCVSAGCEDRLLLPFHQDVLNGRLPLSIGGGIGQSRLCMLLLGKAHIGEVQVSLWPSDMVEDCAKNNIYLL